MALGTAGELVLVEPIPDASETVGGLLLTVSNMLTVPSPLDAIPVLDL